MSADKKMLLAAAYLRLSREETKNSESTSIDTQRSIITDYCHTNGIHLVRCFDDDGRSGSDFDRPGFHALMRELEKGTINMVITKDLSRLGRDMRESSYYAETFFPEHGIRYVAIFDGFDTERDNVMAPFQFAMNEVYLRDGSRKVREALKSRRENGKYCACPPYGYRKDTRDKNKLVPDEETAPVVRQIFAMYCEGISCEGIAVHLTQQGTIPPLKYRVLYRDNFGERGASRASDTWNWMTVRRILKNPVYMGHTVLGKTKKVSMKSKKKVTIPKEDWTYIRDTHEALVSEDSFERAAELMRRGTKLYNTQAKTVRKSVLSGLVFCAKCGHAMCSGGTVYEGERDRYWYLECNHTNKHKSNPCSGTRVRYHDLVEVVRQDLNRLLRMSPSDVDDVIRVLMEQDSQTQAERDRVLQLEKAEARYATIGKVISKLYADNVTGLIDDDQLHHLVSDLRAESEILKSRIEALRKPLAANSKVDNYRKFLELVKKCTEVEELTEETARTFIRRIEVGDREYEDGINPRSRTAPYKQHIRIFYRFIGDLDGDALRPFPAASGPHNTSPPTAV